MIAGHVINENDYIPPRHFPSHAKFIARMRTPLGWLARLVRDKYIHDAITFEGSISKENRKIFVLTFIRVNMICGLYSYAKSEMLSNTHTHTHTDQVP